MHNSDLWMVFDAGPKYLFHYAYSKGIVGIYVGLTASFDFRSVLHDRNFQLASLDAWNIALPVLTRLLRAASDSFHRQRNEMPNNS
jgi:hypothetical protein